ncbi:MAG TPA: hypothetical protein QF469_00225 [Sphingomonas sanguinis]|nr:hypothetical protein [Sphingomonas sanguinis]
MTHPGPSAAPANLVDGVPEALVDERVARRSFVRASKWHSYSHKDAKISNIMQRKRKMDHFGSYS